MQISCQKGSDTKMQKCLVGIAKVYYCYYTIDRMNFNVVLIK